MRARDLRTRVRHLPGIPSVTAAEQWEVRGAHRAGRASPPALVTTVVPTHGRQAMVAAAVESALGQTVEDHVVLVVADGQPAPALKAHARLKVVALSRHRGVPGLVRNVGIRISSSPYLAFLDDDNTWEPNHL
ncbi:MAG: glycosyltransferase family A protein, partial [Acidimicrobiales bacterium]